MSELMLSARGLGKAFHLGHRPTATRMTDALWQWMRRWTSPRIHDDEFWALSDVSFEIQSGEVVGLIGHNGAGKSTLLKLLAQIFRPTTGTLEIHGRIGSLLEVGTGFHPELTGRENIFLNGAILGMSRREIAAKLDQIIEFSEVEAFLDLPVKQYSSGMALRLAFSIAAHLEPEILIVDEVLAVGDIPFQRKCLGRLEDLSSKGGRTVLLVSHNPSALASLCSRGLVLEQGGLAFDGPIQDALQFYLEKDAGGTHPRWEGDSGDEHLRLRSAWVRPINGGNVWDTGGALEVGATIDIREPVEGLIFGFRLLSEFGAELVYCLYDDAETEPATIATPGRLTQTWIIPARTLAAGRFRIAFELGLAYRKVSHRGMTGELTFDLENLTGMGRRYPVQGSRGFNSLLRPDWAHTTTREPSGDA